MKLLQTILLISIFQFSFSQTPFYSIYELDSLSKDSTGIVVDKNADRSLKIWGERLSPKGNFSPAASAVFEYAEAFNENMVSQDGPSRYASSAGWIELGPVGDSLTHFRTNGGIGRINRIRFSPTYWDDSTVYATTYSGGLWRSWNDGHNWVEFGTDLQLPITSASDVFVHPTDSSIIFMTTGDNDYGSPYSTSPWIRFGTNPIFTTGVYRGNITGVKGSATVQWECINGNSAEDGTYFLKEFIDNGGGATNQIIGRMNPEDDAKVQLFIASSLGVYRTQDAMLPTSIENPCTETEWERVLMGEFWSPDMDTLDPAIDPDDSFMGLAFHPAEDDVVYASGRNIYVSSENGDEGSWERITGPGTGLKWRDTNRFPCGLFVHRINIVTSPQEGKEDFLWAYIMGTKTSGSCKRRL